MTESKCGWAGRLPATGVSVLCESCQLMKDHVGILRCRRGPPSKTPGAVRAIPETSVRKVPTELVGTALAARITWLTGITATNASCQCKTLADEMDRWGIDGCNENREEIVAKLVSKRDMLAAAIASHGVPHALIGWTLNTRLADPVLRRGANWLLDKAIADTIALRDNPAGDGTTREQNRKHAETLAADKPSPDPFTADPIIHLGCHLWPIRGQWQWHADKWIERAETINGRVIVGVAIDASTDTLDTVRAYFPERFELFSFPNSPQGENPTFRGLLERLPTGPDDVLIYCHSKGVRPGAYDHEAVNLWCELMYETVVFNDMAITRRMAEGYAAFVSFRTYFGHPIPQKYGWHGSGTYLAVRLARCRGLTLDSTVYGAVEAWLGNHIPASSAWCEFGDNRALMDQYKIDRLYPRDVDAQMDWEARRLGGPRCEQHQRELDWFAGHLRPTDRVLVIGSKHGGLEHQLRLRHPGITTMSIDNDPQADNTCEILRGSSHDALVQTLARERGPFDVVFIDGDHTRDGVRQDWEFAQSLRPRMIAFHDIADAIKHRKEGCDVDRLWAEIKATHQTAEKIVGCGWGGIGIVHMGER